jgi:hypothetical protein
MEGTIQILWSLNGIGDPNGTMLANSRDLKNLDRAATEKSRRSGQAPVNRRSDRGVDIRVKGFHSPDHAIILGAVQD